MDLKQHEFDRSRAAAKAIEDAVAPARETHRAVEAAGVDQFAREIERFRSPAEDYLKTAKAQILNLGSALQGIPSMVSFGADAWNDMQDAARHLLDVPGLQSVLTGLEH